jgi:WD40 repeat protein/tRNA A-37 threonylcarbamoyl transferase component Bud32
MSALCPHCQSSLPPCDPGVKAVVCPSCGSSIQLDPNATTGWLPEEAPKRLGKFEFLEQLGTGSFGTVYKARDTELDRTVAIKIPRAGSLPRAQDMERFLREAKSAAQLKHPSIVALHDAGTIDGTCCLVSEFIPGATLAERLSAKRFSFRQAAELMAEVAEALHYAHQHGVVHRDIKPSNIMLDLEGRPHLMDFGLAKRAADESTMTLEGQVLGTPAYMAPEQARGEVRKVDSRSDIYSLGVILYELLTGELPFRGQTRMLLVQVIQDEPRPPRRLNDSIPRDLETVCLKAMAKEASRRYQTAGELADDLRRFLKGEPIQARPVGTIERARHWCKRNRLATALIVSLVIGIAATTGVSNWALLERGRADRKATEALDEKQRADEIADEAEANLYVARMNVAQTDWVNANVERVLDMLKPYRQPRAGKPDPRGWEWFYQDRLCHLELRRFEGHTDWIRNLAFSPDGSRLAAGSWNHAVKIWDVATGKALATLNGHSGVVWGVAFSPDGSRLVSGSADGTIKLWNTADNQELRTLKGHTGAIRSVAFSPDGGRLASASVDKTVKIWNMAGGKGPITLSGHSDEVLSVAFNRDGSRLASGSNDHTVKVWPVVGGQALLTLKNPWGGHSVAFSPDGNRLATASEQRVKVWDAVGGQELRTLQGHTGIIASVAFNHDGTLLASGSFDRMIKIWDADSGQELRTLKGHTASVFSVAFSPHGGWLAAGDGGGTIKLWDTVGGQEPRALTGQSDWFGGTAFCPDGRRFASGTADGTIKVWDLVSDRELRALKGHTGWVSVAFSRDGSRLASGNDDKTVRIWDAVNGGELHTLRGHTDSTLSAAFSPDARRLASGSEDQTIKIWDTTSGQNLHTLKGRSSVWDVAFSPDGGVLASAHRDGVVRVWDVANGLELRQLQGGGGTSDWITRVAFSPDGRQLASGVTNGKIKLWDAASLEELRTIKAHTGPVVCLAFSPDSSRLVSGSQDQKVKIWNVASGQELRSFREAGSVVWDVAFSPDGWQVASVRAKDNVIHFWDARPWTPELRRQREALGLLEYWCPKSPSKEIVSERIRADKGITEDIRHESLSMLEDYWPRHIRAEANAYVIRLNGEGRLPSEALKIIRADRTLRDTVRKQALDLAEHELENAKALNDRSRQIVHRPDAKTEDYHAALRQAEAACRVDPENANYRNTLGIAQYRAGKYEEARETLKKADPANKDTPANLAFLAMAQHRVDKKEEAKATLARLREVLKHERWANDAEAQSFLREAQELIAAKLELRKE